MNGSDGLPGQRGLPGKMVMFDHPVYLQELYSVASSSLYVCMYIHVYAYSRHILSVA